VRWKVVHGIATVLRVVVVVVEELDPPLAVFAAAPLVSRTV